MTSLYLKSVNDLSYIYDINGTIYYYFTGEQLLFIESYAISDAQLLKRVIKLSMSVIYLQCPNEWDL